MPAKEPSANFRLNGPSPSHTWLLRKGRRLEIEPDKPLIHRSVLPVIAILSMIFRLESGMRLFRAYWTSSYAG
jgi:hypothetical protein